MEATRGAALSSAPTGNPIVPDSILGTSRSRGGRSTAGSPARARCSAWEIGRSGRARSRKGQHAPHRAGRGEEAKGQGQAVPDPLNKTKYRLRVPQVLSASTGICPVPPKRGTGRERDVSGGPG